MDQRQPPSPDDCGPAQAIRRALGKRPAADALPRVDGLPRARRIRIVRHLDRCGWSVISDSATIFARSWHDRSGVLTFMPGDGVADQLAASRTRSAFDLDHAERQSPSAGNRASASSTGAGARGRRAARPESDRSRPDGYRLSRSSMVKVLAVAARPSPPPCRPPQCARRPACRRRKPCRRRPLSDRGRNRGAFDLCCQPYFTDCPAVCVSSSGKTQHA